MTPELEIAADMRELAELCARQIVQHVQRAIDTRGRARLCASGGSTPRAVYARLARPDLAGQLDLERLHIYFGDERCVPPDHPDSNYRMLHESFLAHVAVPEANVHRMAGEQPPEQARAAYEAELRAELAAAASGKPREPFDVVLLGLGEDGHTASLFPGSPLEAAAWVATRQQPQTAQWRITLTEPALNAARLALFMVSGSAKAQRVFEVLHGPRDPQRLPAQRIVPSGRLRFCIDRAAAQRMLSA